MSDPGLVDEELDTGPRRHYPRWLGPLAGVVAVAVAVTALVANGTGTGTGHRPTATRTAPASVGSARAIVGVPGGGEFVELVGDRLQILRPDGSRIRQSAPTRVVGDSYDTLQLDVDGPARTVWIVYALSNESGYAESYSLSDLHLLTRVRLTAPIRGSAAVGGRLYVVDSDSIAVLDEDGTAFDPVPLGGYVESVTADPARHRALVFDSVKGGEEIIVLRGTTLGPASLPLPGGPTAVVVAGGSIWIDGYDQIIGLDPVSLAPRVTVAEPHTDGGVQLVGTGDSSLFLRPSESEQPLVCVDAATGRERQYWPDVPGIVAATRHRALVAPILGAPENLELHGCAG